MHQTTLWEESQMLVENCAAGRERETISCGLAMHNREPRFPYDPSFYRGKKSKTQAKLNNHRFLYFLLYTIMCFDELISYFSSLFGITFCKQFRRTDIIVEDFETTYLFEHNDF
jgi:hypothetical protein